jgi:hypothetical protein
MAVAFFKFIIIIFFLHVVNGAPYNLKLKLVKNHVQFHFLLEFFLSPPLLPNPNSVSTVAFTL